MNLFKRACISSVGIYMGSALQYENKTHMAGKFQRCRRKGKILKAFMEKFFFLQRNKTQTTIRAVRRYVIYVRR